MQLLEAPFSTEEYELRHDVPVFVEHTLDTEQDGQPIHDVYTQRELEYIVDNNNRRIANTGDYVPIVIQHTDPDDRSFDPPVVGFAGPFRLGKLGAVEPKWAIYAENWWIRKDALEDVKKYPRRSVELWREEDPRDRFFDPISLLGAHTPRLDLGLVYSRGSEARRIVRYSAVMPGGANTFAPAWGGKKQDYQLEGVGPTEPEHSGETDMPTVEEIVNALEQTDVFQWVRQQMAAEAGNAEEMPGADPEPPPALPDENQPMRRYMGDPELGMEDPEALPPLPDEQMRKRYECDEDEDEGKKVNYARDLRALKDRYAKVEREKRALEARVAKIEHEKLYTVRYSRLKELSLTHVLDPDEEIEDVVKMNEADWDKHQNRILTRYEQIPVGRQIPYEKPPVKLINEDKREQEVAQRAGEYVMEQRRLGNKIDYAAAREHVLRQMKTA